MAQLLTDAEVFGTPAAPVKPNAPVGGGNELSDEQVFGLDPLTESLKRDNSAWGVTKSAVKDTLGYAAGFGGQFMDMAISTGKLFSIPGSTGIILSQGGKESPKNVGAAALEYSNQFLPEWLRSPFERIATALGPESKQYYEENGLGWLMKHFGEGVEKGSAKVEEQAGIPKEYSQLVVGQVMDLLGGKGMKAAAVEGWKTRVLAEEAKLKKRFDAPDEVVVRPGEVGDLAAAEDVAAARTPGPEAQIIDTKAKVKAIFDAAKKEAWEGSEARGVEAVKSLFEAAKRAPKRVEEAVAPVEEIGAEVGAVPKTRSAEGQVLFEEPPPATTPTLLDSAGREVSAALSSGMHKLEQGKGFDLTAAEKIALRGAAQASEKLQSGPSRFQRGYTDWEHLTKVFVASGATTALGIWAYRKYKEWEKMRDWEENWKEQNKEYDEMLKRREEHLRNFMPDPVGVPQPIKPEHRTVDGNALAALGGAAAAGAVKSVKGGNIHPDLITRLATPLVQALSRGGIDAVHQLSLNKQFTEWTLDRIRKYTQKYLGHESDPLKDIELSNGKRWEDAVDNVLRSSKKTATKNETLTEVPEGADVWNFTNGHESGSHTVANDLVAINERLQHVGDYLREHYQSPIGTGLSFWEEAASRKFKEANPEPKLGEPGFAKWLERIEATSEYQNWKNPLSQVDLVRAVKETAKWDKELAAKMEKAAADETKEMPVYKEYPDGMKWVEVRAKPLSELPEGWNVAEVQGEWRFFKRADQLDGPGWGSYETKAAAVKGALDEISYEKTKRMLQSEGDQMGHCFPAGTLVTSPQPQLIERLRIGDEVITHTGAVRKITELFRRPYEGELISIETRGGLPFECTPEHPILIVRPQSTGSKWKDRYVENRLPTTLLPQWTIAKHLQEGDYLLSPGIQQTAQANPELDDFSWMLGLYAGDGDPNAGAGLQFTLSPNDNLERLRRVIEQLGYTPRFSDKETFYRVRVNSIELSKQFRNWFSDYSQTKHLPSMLFDGATNLKAVLEGLTDADGTYYEGRYRFTSTSIALAQQVWIIAVTLGYRPSIKPLRRVSGFANASPSWSVEWQETEGKWHSNIRWNSFYATPIVAIKHRAYKGTVYNIEVEEDHSYLVNGLAVHNCVGGYCDYVESGDSKIYSLRDAKGKSHVTIEVSPGLSKETSYSGKIETPADIRQIKGKQNRAPVAQYQKYVQDFVRNGADGTPAKWGEVGDLENSGLVDAGNLLANQKIPFNAPERYMKPAELDAWLKERGVSSPELKRRVAEWDEPDIMGDFPGERGAADPRLLARMAAVAVGATIGANVSDNKLLGAIVGGIGAGAAMKLSPKGAAAAVKNAFAADKRIRINDFANEHDAGIARAGRAIWQQQMGVVDIAKKDAERIAITHAIQQGTAGNLPPTLRAAATRAQEFFAAIGEQGQKTGVLKDLIDNYVTNLWDLTGKNKDAWSQIIERAGGPSMSPESRFALRRRITNLEEGKKLGLVPKTEDVAEIMGIYGNSLMRSVENKKLLESLRAATDPASGTKLLLPSKKAPHEYVIIDHPQMNGVRVHPDIAPSLRFIFDNSDPGVVSAGLQGINTALKRSAVSFSLFHAKALADANIGAHGLLLGIPKTLKTIAQSAAPAIFGKDLYLKQLREGGAGDLVDKALEGGLKISFEKGKLADEDIGGSFYPALKAAQKGLDSIIPGAGLPVKATIALNHAVDAFMWERLHAAMKLGTFASKLEVVRNANAKAVSRGSAEAMTEKQLAEQAASFTNDIFGGLNWRRIAEEAHTKWGRDIALAAYSPKGRQVMQLMMFAPDWTISTTRAASRAFGQLLGYDKGTGLRGLLEPQNATDLHRRYMIRSAFYYAIVGTGINYALSGKMLWDNKDPTMIDMGDGRTMQWSKHSMEPVHWITKPGQQALNKLGFFPKEAANQMLGTEYLSASGRAPKMDTSLPGRVEHVGRSMLPIAAQQAFGSNASAGSGLAGFLGAPIYGKTWEERKAIKEQRKREATRRRIEKRAAEGR